MRMPFGRRHEAMMLPTGSLSLRIVSIPAAIASIPAASSCNRSRKVGLAPPAFASARSSALAAKMAAREPRTASAMAASARFLCAAVASASTRAAARASRPMARIVASSFPELAIALRGAFMALIRQELSIF
jgi:hypothetical protein